ncbi:uncharacterized protein LOC120105098 [Phoenix dactylifera]|uniref:Uncharacterized protein LOC120105098 n=1 Tax=Phoenix dactylifera TaxID=42345 RepID=A0A8B8ZIK1_PHODC|nr:uncharacterized protein LOC120105098 [Phoenix dactylifera]
MGLKRYALLRDCGIPDSRIGKILMTSTRFVGLSVDSVKAYIERAENLEVPHSSRMFWQAFVAVVCHSKATVDAKFRLYKSLGWSEAEASSAISKTPKLLHLSDKMVYKKMDFLMKEVGCKISYVAHRPALLTYSLERRLIPRYHVLRILLKNNVPEGDQDFFATVMVPEVKFLNKYVLPHKEKIPGIHEAYVAACAGNVIN